MAQQGKDFVITDSGKLERMYAHPDDAAEFAANLPNKFLACRERRHTPEAYTAEWLREQRCYRRQLICSRCGTVIRQLISATGELLAQSYLYPEGYLAHRMGRIVGEGRDAVRLESVKRDIENQGRKKLKAVK